MNQNLCVSEAVSPGHPDKIADQLADRILNTCLAQDKHSRVACEVCFGKKIVFVTGEISSQATYNISTILYQLLNDCGYTESFLGCNPIEWQVINNISHQSSDIYQAVFKEGRVAAGDQGIAQGYACGDTLEFLPLSLTLANRLIERLWDCHFKHSLIGPDAKSQVGMDISDPQNPTLSHLVLSVQHKDLISQQELKKVLKDCVNHVVPAKYILPHSKIFLNPSGSFVQGGPLADSGLTGRKIIADNYGPMIAHGGGSFSGKDPSKVDRSGAYYARYIAKNIVAAGIAKKVLLTYSFVIGQLKPVDISLNTFGTSPFSESYILECLKEFIDVDVQKMIEKLDLQAPIYENISKGCHFGRQAKDQSWEKTDLMEVFKQLY